MSFLRHVARQRAFVCRQCTRQQHTLARGEGAAKRWADQQPEAAAREAEWEAHAGKVRAGMQQSMLSVLEERGFVKDVAG
jgi:tyrosyl-tRNA synthetase